MCVACTKRYQFCLEISNDISHKKELISISAKLAANTPYSLILGRPTLNKHNILLKNVKHFSSLESLSALLASESNSNISTLAALPDPSGIAIQNMEAKGNRFTKGDFLTPAPDHDYIPPEMDVDYPWDRDISQQDKDVVNMITFEGNPNFVNRMRNKCFEFIDIFSCELRAEPADLPAMELVVDKARWHVDKHRGPARVQSTDNQLETIRQIGKMVKAKVIQPSQATEYSHVLLTPKPGGKKRFCIDFRMFNLCYEAMGWPIPNI